MKKDGTFIGKKNVRFSENECKKIKKIALCLASLFPDKKYFIIKKENFTSPDNTLDVMSHTIDVIIPLISKNKKIHYKYGSTYFIEGASKIVLHFTNKMGKGADGIEKKQADCYMSFHGIWEREFRHKLKYIYSRNPHFGYGYSVDTIWSEMILPCLKIFYNDLGKVFGMSGNIPDKYDIK